MKAKSNKERVWMVRFRMEFAIWKGDSVSHPLLLGVRLQILASCCEKVVCFCFMVWNWNEFGFVIHG